MPIEVHKRFFKDRVEVLADLARDGFWPTTFVSGPSPGLPVHWHEYEVHGYVIEGETTVLDGASDTHLKLEPGDKLIIPARTLHAEGEVRERVVYIIGAAEPLPMSQLLALHPPDEL